MNILEKFSLKPYNTFGIDTIADYFVEVSTITELKSVLEFSKLKNLQILFLGGGSNVLFVNDFKGIAIKLNLKGIKIINEDDNHVWIEAKGSENWHQFVLWSIDKNFGGIENLSLIPGNVGTSPIQNIGAYGVEVKDVIDKVHVVNIENLEEEIFTNSDCNFAYRDSIFKSKFKGKYVIVSVTFKLTKKQHVLKTSYGAVQAQLSNMGVSNPTIRDVSNAIIYIRESKLPDPALIGNSGSFFKNPTVDKELFNFLLEKYPTIINYPVSDGVKLAAGWLIEQAGWKGKRIGDAGVHAKQALVLVNYGGASGKEIYNLSQQIIEDIKDKFGITLEREVNMIF